MLIYLVRISHVCFSLLWYAFLIYSPGLHLIWWKLVFLEMMRLFTMKEALVEVVFMCVCIVQYVLCVCVPSFSTGLCFPPLPSSYLTAEHNKCSFIYIWMQHCLRDDWIIVQWELDVSLLTPLNSHSPLQWLSQPCSPPRASQLAAPPPPRSTLSQLKERKKDAVLHVGVMERKKKHRGV